jgi:hypothetical protein
MLKCLARLMRCLELTKEIPMPNEWDEFVVRIGKLALAVGALEIAVISLVCDILGRTEEEIGIHSNSWWCQRLNEIAPVSWTNEQKEGLADRLKTIRDLYRSRNQTIHAAFGIAGEGVIPGIPAGSVIDLRSVGIGFTSQEGNTWTLGALGKRVHLSEISRLTDEIHAARVSLIAYMELVDDIKHPPRPFPMPVLGKKL